MRLKNASEATPQTDEGLVPTAGVERTPAAAPLRREAAVSSRIEATVAVVWPVGSPSTGVRAMNVARTAAEVLAEHATLELECVDRMYLNAYVPILQTCGGAAWFFRKVRGKPVPSSALMAPMTRDFVAGIERFAEGAGVEVVKFGRRERKEERMREHLRRFPGGEGVLFVGKAQEKTKVVRSERRIHEPSGSHYVQLVPATAMVNHYYFYLVDDDFGPMFVKFCSYFPYTARLCVNGHEYVKRQLAKRGVAFEAADNSILSCADPALAQDLADSLTAERIDDLLRKWLKRLPHPFTRDDRAAGIHYEISILLTGVRAHAGLRPPRPGSRVLRGGDPREPRPGASRPGAADLRPAHRPAHPDAEPAPRHHQRGGPVAARGLQALPHVSGGGASASRKTIGSRPTDACSASSASATTPPSARRR